MPELMGRRTVVQSVALLAPLLIVGGCAPTTNPNVQASEVQEDEPEPVAVTVFTDEALLFMEYPRLVPGLEARFLAHVTVLATGEPVRSGRLRLEFIGSSGNASALEAPQPTRDGLFIPVGAFDVPGQYEAQIVVTSDQVEATIPLPPVVVHADLAGAFAAAEAEATDEPADAVPFLLEQQWKIGLLMQQAGKRSLTKRLQVPAVIEAPQHAMAVANAPLAGRLLPPESGSLPHLGERVEKGQVLAYLEPALTVSDTAQWAANEAANKALEMELLVREFDLQARALEIEQALQLSRTRLEFASQTLARIEGLRAKDLGTVAELQSARRDVEIARRDSQGAESLKESFARAGEQLDLLRERSAALRSDTEAIGPGRHALTAPIAGEVVAVNHVFGEQVESQAAVFRLLDLSRVWIAAHVSEFDLARVGAAPGATLRVAAHPERSFDVLGELEGRVVHFAKVVDPETRSVALRYEVANPAGLLRAGMFADVFIDTEQAVDAVAVPEQAIVMDNGRPVAFVLLHGEAFQKRVLELGIRDAGFVQVRAGIAEGERVVTKGAYLVKLASASPASFGEGHAH